MPQSPRSAGHDPAADPRAQREHHQAPRILTRPGPILTVGCGVPIVLEHCGLFQPLREELAEISRESLVEEFQLDARDEYKAKEEEMGLELMR